MIEKLLLARVAHEDCNGGVIFDNLKCDLWKDILTILEIIHKALIDEKIELLTIKRMKNENERDIVPNHRYLIRKNKPDELDLKPAVEKQSEHNLEKTVKKGRERKEKLTEAQLEEQRRKQQEEEEIKLEEERIRQKYIEEERQLLDVPKPKEMSEQEWEEYQQRYDKICEKF